MNPILLLLLALGAGPAVAEAPITAFCGGGVTGGGGGMRAEADGGITRLQRSGPVGPLRETALGRDAGAVAAWQAALDAAGFEALRLQGAGNMTCSLARGGHRLSWPHGALPAALPPALGTVFQGLLGWRPEP